VVGEMEEDLDEELRRIVSGQQFGAELFDMLPEPPFAGQVIEACAIVEAEAEAEIGALRAKLHQLSDTGFAPGDIGGRMKCAILLAGAGASLVGLVLIPVALIPGMVVTAVGILLTTLASANGWTCKRAGDVATTTP